MKAKKSGVIFANLFFLFFLSSAPGIFQSTEKFSWTQVSVAEAAMTEDTESAAQETAVAEVAAQEQEESLPAEEQQSVVATSGELVPDSGNVTLDFKDADIINVLRILSLKSGVNIVTGPEVAGTVTIRLKDVPWEKALEIVLRTYGYVYEREGNIIRVTTKENLQTEELITEAFVLNYSTSAEIEEAIQEIISERGRIKSVPRTNTVIVTDAPTNVYKVGEIIKKLDKRTPQVYIDSKVVRTELGVTENLGIDWNVVGTISGASRPTTLPFVSGPEGFQQKYNSFANVLTGVTPRNDATEGTSSSGTSGEATSSSFAGTSGFPNASKDDFTFGQLDFTKFTAVLNLLKSRISTKIISNPRIVTLNHQKANVQVGEEIGIPQFERNENTGSFEVSGFEPRNVGVVLNVTPHVNDTGEILVELQPEVSSFDGFSPIGGTNLSFPSFTTTRAVTQVLIKNSETIAIGGLLTDAEAGTYSRVPVVGSIPLIGRLFRSTRQSAGSNGKVETLFFVTCTIVDIEGQPEKIHNSLVVPAADVPATSATAAATKTYSNI